MTDHQCSTSAVAFSQSLALAQILHNRSACPRVRTDAPGAKVLRGPRPHLAQARGSTRVYTLRDRARVAVIVRAKAPGSHWRSRTPWQPRTRWGADLTLTEAQVADQIAHLEQQKGRGRCGSGRTERAQGATAGGKSG